MEDSEQRLSNYRFETPSNKRRSANKNDSMKSEPLAGTSSVADASIWSLKSERWIKQDIKLKINYSKIRLINWNIN
jgi:hypothetical protein